MDKQCNYSDVDFHAGSRHDWRLWERERRADETGESVTWRYVWYCTKCRGIEVDVRGEAEARVDP